MPQVDFGWVLRPTPFVGMQPADLYEYNRASIQALSPEFSTVWMEDHFQWGEGGMSGEKPTLEALTTMAYVAAEFPQHKIGAIVLGQGYRNPAYLAKAYGSLHYLTGGRLIMGIGAGWKADEYKAYGYPFPSVGERMDELEDTVQIFRAMWTQSPATFHGKRYSIENAYCAPLPNPPIPILVGGGGEKRLLRIVAQYADAWNVNICAPEVFQHKLEVLRQHCQEVGRNPDEIQLTYYADIDLPDDPADFGKTTERYTIGPTPEEAVDQLRQFVVMGVSHIMIRTTSLETLKKFSAEVAPAFAE